MSHTVWLSPIIQGPRISPGAGMPLQAGLWPMSCGLLPESPIFDRATRQTPPSSVIVLLDQQHTPQRVEDDRGRPLRRFLQSHRPHLTTQVESERCRCQLTNVPERAAPSYPSRCDRPC